MTGSARFAARLSLVAAPVVLTALWLSSSEAPGPTAMFNDYLWRLGNVTRMDGDSPRIAVNDHQQLRYPRIRELRVPLQDIRIGFIAFFHLDRCRVMQQISQRNSSLGRLQSTPSRLHYEVDLLERLQQCLPAVGTGEDNSHLQQELQTLVSLKQQNLPGLLWNSSFASGEFARLFALTEGPIRPGENMPGQQLEQALRGLLQLFEAASNGDYSPPVAAALHENYFVIQSQPFAGRLLQSMAVATDGLEAATAMLESAYRQKRICPMDKSTRQARHLHNVFVRFYAGSIQPWLSTVHTAARQSIPALSRLQQIQTRAQSPAFVAFWEGTMAATHSSSVWSRFRRALESHTHAWQQLLGQCELMPTGPDSLRAR